MKRILLATLCILFGGNLLAQTYDYEIRLEKRRGGADSLLLDVFIINKQATDLEIGSGDIPIQFSVADWAAISAGTGATLIDTTGSKLNGTSDWESNVAIPYEPMVLSVSTISRRLIVRFVKSYNFPSPAAIPGGREFVQNDTVRIGTIYTRLAGAPYCEVNLDPQFVIAGTIGSWEDDGFGNPTYLIHQTIITPITVDVTRTADAPISTRLLRNAGSDSTIYVDTLILYGEPLAVGETGIWSALGASTATFDTPTSPTSIVRDLGAGGLPDSLVWTYTVTANGCVYEDTVIVTAQLWSIDFPLVNDTLCSSSGPYTALDATSTLVVGPGTWTSFPVGSLDFVDPSLHNSAVSVNPAFAGGTYQAIWTQNALPNLADTVDLTFVFLEAGVDSTVCNTDSLVLYAETVPVAFGTGTWSSPSGVITFDTPTDFNSVVRTTVPGTYRLYWNTAAAVGTCGIVRDSLDVSFNYAVAGVTDSTCSDSIYTLNATALVGAAWSSAVGNPGTATFTNATLETSDVSVNTPGTYKFYWGYNAGLPCGIIQDSVEVTFLFLNAGADSSVCNNDSLILYADPVPGFFGVTGEWFSASPEISFDTPTSPTSVVRTTTPGTYSLTWRTTGAVGTCPLVQNSMDVTFNYAVAGVTDSTCSDSIYTLNATALVGAAWSSAVGNPGTATFTNATLETSDVSVNTPGTYKFYWGYNAGLPCGIIQDSVEVTFLFLNAGADSSVCNNDSLILYADPVPGFFGVTGEWFSASPEISFDTPTSPTSVVRTTTPGTYSLTWRTTGAVGTCPLVQNSMDVTFNYAVAGVTDSTCSDSIYTLNATALVGAAWSSAVGNPGTATFTNASLETSDVSVNTPGTYKFYWGYNAGLPCGIIQDSVEVTFLFLNAGADSSVCNNDSLILYADPVPGFFGVTGEWFSASPEISFDTPTSPTSVVRTTTPGTYSLTWRTTGAVGTCPLVQNSMDVTFNYAVAGVTDSTCSDSIYTLNATALVGAAWSSAVGNPGTATFTNASLETSDVSVNTPGTYKFYWGYNAGLPCGIIQDSVEVTFLFLNAGADSSVCNNDSLILYADPVPGFFGVTGEWFSASPEISFDTPTSPTSVVRTTTPGTYSLTWRTTGAVGTCPLVQNSMDVTFNYAVAGVTDSTCSDSIYTLNATALVGAAWSSAVGNPGTATFTNATLETSDVSVNTPGTYKFYWGYNAGLPCGIIQDSVEVTFLFLNAGVDSSVCSADSLILYADPVPGFFGVTGEWFSASPEISFDTPTSPTSVVRATTPGTYSLTWRTTGAVGTCPLVQNSMDVTFSIVEAGTALATVCDDSTVTLAATVVSAPLTGGAWTISGPGTATFVPNATTANAIATVSAPGDYVFYWSADPIGGCTPTDSVLVAFRFVNAGPDQSLCDVNTTVLAGSDPTAIGAGGGIWTVLTVPGGSGVPVFSDATDPLSTFTVDTPGIYELAWTSTGANPTGCLGPVDDAVLITFNYVTAGNDTNICGLTMNNLQGSDASGQIGVGAAWTLISGPGTETFSPSNTAFDASVTVTTPGTYVFRWTTVAPGPGCAINHQDEVTIDFVVAAAGADQDICSNTTALAATAPGGVFIGMWVPINAGFSVLDPLDPATTFTTTNPAGSSDTLAWEITDGSCLTRDTVVIRNNRVDVKTVEGDTTFCGAGTPIIRIVGSDVGVDYTAYDGVTPLSGTIAGNGGVLNLPLTLFPASGNLTVQVEGTRTVPFACASNMTNTVQVERTAGLGLELTVFLQGCLDTTGATPVNLAVLNNGAPYTLLDDIFSSGTGVGVPDPTGFVQPADTNASVVNLPANAVDVLKIEIRSAIAGPAIDSAYAWLMADGSVTDFSTASNTAINFCDGNPDGNYYIVVRHKNHVPAMSSVAVPLNTVTASAWSFNNPANYYQDPGLTPAVAIVNKTTAPAYTVYALLSGNVYDNTVFNDVGEVNAADFFRMRVTSVSNPANVYGQTDASLDGDLNAFDVTLVRENNNDLRITSMPNP